MYICIAIKQKKMFNHSTNMMCCMCTPQMKGLIAYCQK